MLDRLKRNPVIDLFDYTWRFAKGFRGRFVLALILLVCASLVLFAEPLLLAHLLNIIQMQGVVKESVPSLAWCLAGLLLIPFIQWCFHGPARVLELDVAVRARNAYKQHLFAGVLRLPLEWHTDHHSGDTIDKIEKGSNGLYQFSSNIFQVVEFVVRLVSSCVGLVYFNLHAGYIVVFMVILTLLTVLKFDQTLTRSYDHLLKADNTISAKVFDAISNITTVVVLRIEPLITTSFVKSLREPLALFRKTNVVNETKWMSVSMLASLSTVLVLASSLWGTYTSGGVILVGTVVALYGYLTRISELFFRFAWLYGDFVHHHAAVRRATTLEREFREKKGIKERKWSDNWSSLDIQDLTFSYQTAEKDRLHLDHVSLSIKRGQKIALIGASGSGKTTCLKIIRELYPPKHAKIFLDGVRLKNGLTEVSSQIALIPQEPEIFADTIRENLTLGIPRSVSAIKRFTDMACVTDVIEKLPHKLDSLMTERGVNLSGGQKQRLALARGLMACEDKAILLFDEPTSSVDPATERRIFENIFTHFTEPAIVTTVHRMHLLPLFDEVVWFEEGRIKARGSCKELLETNDAFASLWKTYHAVQHDPHIEE